MDAEHVLMMLKGKHARARADCHTPMFSPLKPLRSIFYSFPSLIRQRDPLVQPNFFLMESLDSAPPCLLNLGL